MNYDLSFVVTITVTCYSWAPSSGDHIFACGAIYQPPQKYICTWLTAISCHCLVALIEKTFVFNSHMQA